ncbi:MAG TPA: serine hydrolase [Gemmatimonadaceae bacterium]|nr:serine hydrolase [Gemmatimonadaceae bacterium]
MRRSTDIRAFAFMITVAALASGAEGQTPSRGNVRVTSTVSLLPDSAIATILRQRVEARKTPGIVVGVLDAAGMRYIAHGTGAPGADVLGGTTLFEIGSITKVFTSTILADMVVRGEVALDDPVGKHLPAGTRMPASGDREITLADLATHFSGLPRLPNNLSPRDIRNPYVDYTADKLYAFLAAHQLARAPGARFEYSNLGAGLLGHVLSRRAGTDYETLVRTRVVTPLGMRDTKITLTKADSARLAAGHNAGGQVVPAWDLAALQGAGALRSSAADMLRFLSANMAAYVDSTSSRPLGAAMRLTQTPTHPLGEGADVGLGWIRATTSTGARIFSHDGGTGGHRSFAAFDPARRVAVIVLSASEADVNDIGRHLLDESYPLTRERAAITLPPETLDGLVGEYALAPQFTITITREGSQMYLQATGQPRFPLFAESENGFFLRVVEAQIAFTRGPDGRATSLTLHQGGASRPGPRVK